MTVKELTELRLSELWAEVKEDFWGDLKQEAQRGLKVLLEGRLEWEMEEYIMASPYERTAMRQDYRCGYYARDLETELGVIGGIRVPRCRKGGFEPKVFERYQRRQPQVNRAIRDIFLAGVSTRRVAEVLKPLLGCAPSAATVSEVAKELDEEVRRFQQRPLADKYVYLFLDGITLKVKGALGVRKRLVLCAYGITKDGGRELIAFRQANSESQAAWEAFLNDLYRRGLVGKHLRLIITDGCPGLTAALDMVYPYIMRQRCWAHKLRNVAAKLPRRIQEECLKGAKKIYCASHKREAVRLFWEWAGGWREIAPKAVACLEQDLDELLSFLAFPEGQRRKIRTTNVIERAFREVRRRTRPMSSFANAASCNRIIYAVITHLNNSWKNKPLRHFAQSS